jgi:threonine dehydrogenase-like Zn-dependent dehydrogenase
MRALTYHGTRDVRVDNVADPAIEQPTDAIIRVTSSGICGSDLHLYEVLGAFIDDGDILGHEPMGIVEAVGSEVTHIAPGDRVVIPFNISCGHCYMCAKGLQSQCETTQVHEQDTGAALFGYTKLYGQVPGGQAEFLRVPQAHYGPIKVPEGPPDDRFVYLSDVLPTAWQAVEYANVPEGETVLVLGLGPIGEMSTRIAQQRGAGRVIAVDLVPDRLERARLHGVEALDLTQYNGDLPDAVRELTGGRGPISVIDAVGMEAHGAPVGKLAHKIAGVLPDAVSRPMTEKMGIDRLSALHAAIEIVQRGDLAVGRLRRGGEPDAADPDVRQADQPAHGAGERPALDRRLHGAAGGRRRPARRRELRDPPRAARRGAAGLRDLPEEGGQRVQDPAQALMARAARGGRQRQAAAVTATAIAPPLRTSLG